MWVGIFWTLFCHLFPSAMSSGSLPQVRWHPADGVTEGGTIQLECQVSPSVYGPAIWLKLDPQDPNQHEVISHGRILISQDERISVTFDTLSNTYSLRIKEVSYSDEGGYQCQVPIKPDEEEVQAAPPVVINLLRSSEARFSRGASWSLGSRIFRSYVCSLLLFLITR